MPDPVRRAAEDALLAECECRAVELLLRNSTPSGILAATPTARAAGRRYTSIFGRDAAICALGMAISGEAELVAAARAGLATLARHQAGNGQIPKFVCPETGEVDFWYAGCIDATLWWLIAVRFLDRVATGGTLAVELDEAVAKALSWLGCQEHQGWFLLQQNEASDWADIMPRSGFVLYSNALWYAVKRLYGLAATDETRDHANLLFYPFSGAVPGQRRLRLLTHFVRNRAKPGDCFLSFVNFSFWGEEIDVLGNLLAALTGLADSSRAGRIVRELTSLAAHRPFPMRAVGRPLAPADPLWRRYMERHRQNLPYQYHNGGAWPFIGGFWVLLLARLGMTAGARAELVRVAEANRENDWEFNEWLHGESGRPMGMPGQSWNAALFLLARRGLSERLRLFA